MEQSQGKQRLKVQKEWIICNLFSIILLFLCRLFWEYNESLAERYEKSPLICVWAILYFLVIVFMLTFKLAYLHLAIQLGFAILSVYTLIKNRNILQFLLSLFLVIIAVALDIIWLQVRLR